MSFAVTNQNTGNFITALSQNYGIATQSSGGNGLLYYSTNSGGFSTWYQSISVPNVTFSSISLSGPYGVAAGIDNSSSLPNAQMAVYYTDDGGHTWSLATPTGQALIIPDSILVSIYGSYVLMALNFTTHTSPGGPVCYLYTASNPTPNNWTANFSEHGYAKNVAVTSSSMIVVITNNTDWVGTNIYGSVDGGSGWAYLNTYPFVLTNTSLSSSGFNNSILCGEIGGNGYILYSSDHGNNWYTPNPSTNPTLTNNITQVVSIDGSVAMIGGINNSVDPTITSGFVWYSINGGIDWTDSGEIFYTGNALTFTGISVSGNNGLASLNDSLYGYLLYSTNGGQSWAGGTGVVGIPYTTINDVSLSGDEGVAGTSSGIYYTISPLCYEANTLILISENEEEVYKKVSELKVGDLVKTYKQGYKKIKLLESFKYKPFNRNNDLNLLYKHKENGVVVTGGHSILVDELTEQEKLNNLKHYGFNQTIEDKKLLLACSSDKFEKIDDYREEYHLYHFSLESDNPKEHFGVYITDGILSESCPEDALLKML